MADEVLAQATGVFIRIVMVYGAGWLLWAPLGIRKVDWAIACFGKLALGAIGITVGLAVFYTKGVTVCWALAGLYLAAVWLRQKDGYRGGSEIQVEGRGLFLVILASLSYLGAQWLANDYFNGSVAHFGDEDYGIYAIAAEYLKQTGVERPSPWYELSALAATGKPEPYHYPDLWLAGFCMPAGMPSLTGYLYVFIPFACGVCFVGNIAVFRTFYPGGGDGILIAFFSLFFPAMFYGYNFSAGYQYPVFIWSKIVLTYWVMAAGWLLWRTECASLGFLTLAVLPVLNIIYGPAIFLMFLGLAWVENCKGLPFWRDFARSWVIPFFAAAFLLIYYWRAGNWTVGSENIRLSWNEYIWRMIRGWFAAVVKHLVFVWPLYLTAFLIWLRNKTFFVQERRAVQWWIILFISGILVKGFFNSNVEVDQFFTVIANPLAALGFIVSAGFFITGANFFYFKQINDPARFLREKFLFAGLIGSIFLWSFLQITVIRPQHPGSVSKDFLEEAMHALSGKKSFGGAIANPATLNPYSSNPRMCLYCNFLGMAGKGYWVNSLSVAADESGIRFLERKGAIMRSPFYRFIQTQKRSGIYKSYEQAQLDFINEQEMDFIVVEKGARVPEKIQACAGKTIEDPLSGTRLIILNRPCGS